MSVQRMLALVLMLLQVTGSLKAFAPPGGESPEAARERKRLERVRKNSQSIAKGSRVEVTKLQGGETFRGILLEAGVTSVKVGIEDQVTPINYSEVRSIRTIHDPALCGPYPCRPRHSFKRRLITSIVVVGALFGLAVWGASQTR